MAKKFAIAPIWVPGDPLYGHVSNYRNEDRAKVEEQIRRVVARFGEGFLYIRDRACMWDGELKELPHMFAVMKTEALRDLIPKRQREIFDTFYGEANE